MNCRTQPYLVELKSQTRAVRAHQSASKFAPNRLRPNGHIAGDGGHGFLHRI